MDVKRLLRAVPTRLYDTTTQNITVDVPTSVSNSNAYLIIITNYTENIECCIYNGKSVPQHTYGEAGGKSVAPTHSRPRL
jgi:hypothetical protein